MTTNKFVVTDAGLIEASIATPTGPFIQIVAFKIGDNATVPADASDRSLAGNTVYTGVPSSYSYYDAGTIQINLEVPADIGPFDYGEIGLYLPGDVLFARFSYGVLRTKQTAVSSGFANVLRIKALLRLSQGPAVFQVTTPSAQTTLEVANFSLVNTPQDHPENPILIVHEPNDFQESMLLYKHESTFWNISNYSKIGTATIIGTSDIVHLNASFFASLFQPSTGSIGKYVIQTAGGYFRTITSITGNSAQLAQPIDTASLVGQNVAVYEINTVALSEINKSISNLQMAVSSLHTYLGVAVLTGTQYDAAISVTAPPAEIFSVTFNAPNPANATLKVGPTGPFPLLDAKGNPAPVGMISTNETLTLVIDGDSFIVQAAPGIGGAVISSTPPANPTDGLLWYDTGNSGRGFVWLGSSWVDFCPGGSGGSGSGSSTTESNAGSIVFFASPTAPAGFLAADGSNVSRSTYPDLFAVVGTTYGAGDGSTTFTLPDLRGEFIRGWDHGRGLDTGRVFGSEQLDAFQGHRHSPPLNSTNFLSNPGDWNGFGGGTYGSYHGLTTGDSVTDDVNGAPRVAPETRPRNVALLGCIKTTNSIGGGSSGGGLPAGILIHVDGSTVPDGFLECNGQTVSTTTYPLLFALYGYTHGGSGTSFGVPDYRGEFLRAWDNGRGVDAGRTIGSAQSGSVEGHSHLFDYSSIQSGGTVGGVNNLAVNANTGSGTWSTRTSTGTETRPRNIAAMICVSTGVSSGGSSTPPTPTRTSLALTIAANTNNYVLTNASVPGYVAGNTDLVVTINSGVKIGSTSTANPAFVVDGSFNLADSITLINNGTVSGAGGNGGHGNYPYGGYPVPDPAPGAAGGPGIQALSPIKINNQGVLQGGGGGGGGYGGGGGGGGGGAGLVAGLGGPIQQTNAEVWSGPGSPGTLTTGGAGSDLASYNGMASWVSTGDFGGNGGNPGVAGGSGIGYPNAAGGAGGPSVLGNDYITWLVVGTRHGAVVA